jgi:hypothetical protein
MKLLGKKYSSRREDPLVPWLKTSIMGKTGTVKPSGVIDNSAVTPLLTNDLSTI